MRPALVLEEIDVRLPIWNALTIAIALTFLSLAPGQETGPSGMKHVTIAPRNANRSVQIEALSIERGLPYPSVATLKGNVSIKTPVCLPVGRNRSDGL